MRVRLTYETTFEVTVDLTTNQVEEVTVLQGFSSVSGAAGYIHVVATDRARGQKFTPKHTKRAIEIIKKSEGDGAIGRRPRWKFRRPV